MRSALANPLFARELKERMRSMRAPAVLTAYLVLLGLVVFATERALTTGNSDAFSAAIVGRTVFHYLLFFTLLLVCFLVPAFVSGAVSSERERRTLPLLQVTLMKPRSIVLGKLASSMAFVLLLILATVPFVSISFILGGVTPLDVLRGFAMVIFTGLTIAMIGIGFSANLKRTMSATVLTYALVAALTVGTFLSYALITVAVRTRDNFREPAHRPAWTLVLNPFLGTASAIQGRDTGSFNTSSPFDAMFSFLTTRNPVVIHEIGQDVMGAPGGIARDMPLPIQREVRPVRVDDGFRLPVWPSTVAWYVGIIALGYVIALAGVRAPVGGVGIGRRRLKVGDV